MTKEEAILVLQNDAYVLYEDDSPYDRQAYDMAIKALKEQKHGEWKTVSVECFGGGTMTEYECSLCKERQIIMSNYCPNCGARMDSES